MGEIVWEKFNDNKEQNFISNSYDMRIILHNIKMPFIIFFKDFTREN